MNNQFINAVVRNIKILMHTLMSRYTFFFGKELSTKEIFSKIYEKNYWGIGEKIVDDSFYSGPGSHDSSIVEPYISSVTTFIKSLPYSPVVLDLGCGDFNVGSKIRPCCAHYIAGDIVDDLINFNKNKFKDLNVDFKVFNISTDEIPKVDIIFLRQVLQHLSNKEIKPVVSKLIESCKFLILTEHIPNNKSFPRNLDKPNGPGVRLKMGSGVDLTAPPFSMPFVSKKEICSVPELGGMIQTIVYEMPLVRNQYSS